MLTTKEPIHVLTGETIREIIRSYHTLKLKESGCLYRMTHPVSPFMQALENFYHRLDNKTERLTSLQSLQLAKILFIEPLKFGDKSHYFKKVLSNYFDLNVIAALTASAGRIEHLSDHFETMQRSPKDAVYIAYAVFSLKNHIAGIKRWTTRESLYAEKLYQDLIHQPELAEPIVSTFQALLNFNEKDDLETLLKKDRELEIRLTPLEEKPSIKTR